MGDLVDPAAGGGGSKGPQRAAQSPGKMRDHWVVVVKKPGGIASWKLATKVGNVFSAFFAKKARSSDDVVEVSDLVVVEEVQGVTDREKDALLEESKEFVLNFGAADEIFEMLEIGDMEKKEVPAALKRYFEGLKEYREKIEHFKKKIEAVEIAKSAMGRVKDTIIRSISDPRTDQIKELSERVFKAAERWEANLDHFSRDVELSQRDLDEIRELLS